MALLAEATDLLEGEADPQLAALRANQLATIERLRGNTSEAFASAVTSGRESWSQFLGLDNALWCVATLGDRRPRRRAPRPDRAIPRPDLGWPAVLGCIVGTPPDEPLPAADIDETVGAVRRHLVALWSIQALLMAARFSPEGHPDRERWVEEARRRAGNFPGILDLIDRYLA